MNRRLLTTFTACIFLALAASGCSGTPQDQYSDAVGGLKNARNDLQDAKERVENARKQMQQAQQSFQQAQQKLQARQQDLAQAQNKVQKTATDEVLFRVLQQNVITKDNFSKSAISVGVDQQVVTLTGTVPNEKTHKKAVKMVQDQPGVAHVIDKLRISDSSATAPSPGADANAQSGQNGGQNNGQSNNQNSN